MNASHSRRYASLAIHIYSSFSIFTHSVLFHMLVLSDSLTLSIPSHPQLLRPRPLPLPPCTEQSC
jgi:hypothetical protein